MARRTSLERSDVVRIDAIHHGGMEDAEGGGEGRPTYWWWQCEARRGVACELWHLVSDLWRRRRPVNDRLKSGMSSQRGQLFHRQGNANPEGCNGYHTLVASRQSVRHQGETHFALRGKMWHPAVRVPAVFSGSVLSVSPWFNRQPTGLQSAHATNTKRW